MKVVILAGGLGTRISEESVLKPKPMVEIGDMPILWHIMKTYSYYGFNEFIICAGYKQHIIKEWFADYFLHTSDITFDFTNGNEMIVHSKHTEPWKVTIVDTGLSTNTGGRLLRVANYLKGERFMLTYGDGVADINLNELLKEHESVHKSNDIWVTVSAYNYKQHKGVLTLNNHNDIVSFREKSSQDNQLINIGFMVCEPHILDFIDGDSVSLEDGLLTPLSERNLTHAYIHNGFWQCMDTLREKQQLEKMWNEGVAPWKIW